MTLAETISFLENETERVFARVLNVFSEERRAPAPQSVDGWSAAQYLEHIALVNRYLLILIEKAAARALRQPPPSADELRDNYRLTFPALEEVEAPGAFEWAPPAHMVPAGTLTQSESLTEIESQHHQVRAVLHRLGKGEGIRVKIMMSVNGIGKLDVYQYIYFLLLHTKRHLTEWTGSKKNS